jgi:transposase
LDNCRIHHAEEIWQLVEDEACMWCLSLNSSRYTHIFIAECKLIFLPPYSPDYNLIEQAFSSIKTFLHRNWQDKSLSVMDCACHNITPAKAAGYFKASGYIV